MDQLREPLSATSHNWTERKEHTSLLTSLSLSPLTLFFLLCSYIHVPVFPFFVCKVLEALSQHPPHQLQREPCSYISVMEFFGWVHALPHRTLLLCCVARISNFAAGRNAARPDGAMRHIVNPALVCATESAKSLDLHRTVCITV